MAGSAGVALIVAVVSGLATMAAARAADAVSAGFKTPSGNIHCRLLTEGAATSLRCDAKEVEGRPPPRPDNCHFQWGRAFALLANGGEAHLVCHSDSLGEEQLPVLRYGETWQQEPFTCLSASSGLTCSTPAKHGFVLSKTSQKLY
jgi:hypothetical protein